MPIESDGYSAGNPRMYPLVEGAPRGGRSSIHAWPQITEFLKVAARPVAGPWPPHQAPRPEPGDDTGPIAIVEPRR
ncbi:hypothetical protein [Pseudonocardia hydrocarbonoxydans]|jgi:hypothetical protein|nr:hypothetical protein [Pseudonocardia hydrocarbonoxydans]